MSRKESLPSVNVKFDDRRKKLFLDLFPKMGSVVKTAALVKINPATVHRHLREDEQFRKAFEEANDALVDELEAEAIRRAKDGVKKPIFKDGRVVGYEVVYSDRLLEMLLRGRSDRYKNSTNVKVSGEVDHNVNVNSAKDKLLEKIRSAGVVIDSVEHEIKDVSDFDQGDDHE